MGQSTFHKLFDHRVPTNGATGPKVKKKRERIPPLKVDQTKPRVFVIDDDPTFCKAIQQQGRKQSMDVAVFQSINDISDEQLRQFDVAVVDFDLGCVNGAEFTSYLESRVGPMPVVFVSSTDRTSALQDHLRDGYHSFMMKSVGNGKILDQTVLLNFKANLAGGKKAA